jgi:hypothetical protein
VARAPIAPPPLQAKPAVQAAAPPRIPAPAVAQRHAPPMRTPQALQTAQPVAARPVPATARPQPPLPPPVPRATVAPHVQAKQVQAKMAAPRIAAPPQPRRPHAPPPPCAQPRVPGAPAGRQESPRPGVVQRAIELKASVGATYRKALTAVRNSLDRAPRTRRLFNLAQADAFDLVFRSDIPWYSNRLGTTSQWVNYGTQAKQHLNSAIVAASRANRELNDPITIEVDVVKPVLDFWNRNAGNMASTLAHELAIHAARFVPLIEDVQDDPRVARHINEWVENGIFSLPNRDHHDALRIGNTEDEYRREYRAIVQDVMTYFREDEDESNAHAVHKAYFADLWEHTPGVTSSVMGFWGVTLGDDV